MRFIMKTDLSWKDKVLSIDSRRDLALLEDKDETVRFSVKHFLSLANQAIYDHDFFYVALSGGSTPKAIFSLLSKPEFRLGTDWSKILLFWSDERCVPPTDPDSNYRMAMDAGFSSLPVLEEHIFRMKGEIDPENAADEYNDLIANRVPDGQFDLVMLGIGPDGHTASLFPGTSGLQVKDRSVIANFVPEKETWRLSFTFPLINRAKNIAFYAMGEGKAAILKRVLSDDESPPLPAQQVGTKEHRSLFIVDKAAAAQLR